MGKKVTVETNSTVFKIYIGPNTGVGGDTSADISGVFSSGHTFDFGNGIKTTDFVYKFYAFQWGDYYFTPNNTGWQHVKVVNESYVKYSGYSWVYNPPKRTLTLSVSPAGSGSVSGDGEYNAGTEVSISASAASGYRFLKWSDGDTNSSRKIKLNNDTSLTAYFEKITYTYKITYNDNGGSGGPGYATVTSTSSTISTSIASGTPSRSGYTFKHWNTKSDGSGSSYSPGDSISVSSDITLYAQWTPIKYVLSYNKSDDDAEGDIPSAHDPATEVTLKSTNLRRPASPTTTNYKIKFDNPNGSNGTQTKTGSIVQAYVYAFSKWSIDGTEYSAGSTYKLSSNKTAYARYSSTASAYGDPAISGVICPDPGTRVGHDFTGWLDSNGRVYQVGDKYSYTTGELTAQWAEHPKYYIYFYKDNTEEYPSYITVAPPDAHTWVYSGGSFTLPGNIVSKAQIDNGPYTIIFVPANGSSNITSSYYNRTKYTQNGWAYHNTTTRLSSNETINDIRKDLAFQAYWKSESWNDTIVTPAAPTRTGYTFKGWQLDGTSHIYGAETNYTPGEVSGVAADTPFTAKWEINTYTYNIVYKSSSGVELGTSTITGKFGSSTQVSPKSFTGYTSPGPQTVTFDSTTAKTITFVYTPIEYTITWVLNGGSLSGYKTSYTVEDEYTLPNPTRASYTFDGWYETEDFSGQRVTALIRETGNKVFYAKWLIDYRLEVFKDANSICNVSVSYDNQTSSTTSATLSASLTINSVSSPTFTIKASGGMGTSYDFDYWDYKAGYSKVQFGDDHAKETTAKLTSLVNGNFYAQVTAHLKKISYFKIKLGDHVQSCKINYTPYWGGNTTVTQTSKEETYYAVEETLFSIDKSSIVADYGYVATIGLSGYPDYEDKPLKNIVTIIVSESARYSLSALTNANGTFKGDVMITNDDGATARTFGTIETITVAEQISSKFKIQALPTNPSYYFSHWTRASGTDFTYIDSTKNTDRDARIQFTGTNIETVYGLAMQANFSKWPSVEICCRVSDNLSNPVLNGQYGVGDVKINYTNGPSYASNGEYIGNSKYEIKGYNIAGRGWVSRPGEYLSLEAIPAAGYEFSKWVLQGSQSDTFTTQLLNFQVPFVDCVLYAIFKPVKRDIYIKSNSTIAYNKPGKFYICKGTFDPNLYSYDTSIKILNNVDTFTLVAPIDPAVGYEFDGWYTGSGTKLTHHVLSGCAYVTLTPGEDSYSSNTFVAKYSLKEFTLSTHTRAEILGTTASGTITPSYPDGTTVEYGKSISFNAKPALEPRSKFSKWMLQRSFDNSEQELSTEPNFTYIHNYTCDTTLTAVFDLARILTAHAYTSGGGTIGITHKSGSETNTYSNQTDKTFKFFETDAIILSAKPQTGYKFLYWRYSGPDGRVKETSNSVLNLTPDYLSSLGVNVLTCIAFFEEINYSFYFKQQGGDDKCTTAIKIGLDVYTPQAKPITFTSSSISGQIVRLVSQVREGSEYVFKEWRITNSAGKTFVITSNIYDIDDLSSYGETFTILAVYLKASQGNLTVRVVSGSRIPFNPAAGPETYPAKAGKSALDWYNTGDNSLYYLSPSEANPGVFGQCTWYASGRTAQLRGGAEGSWAPTGDKNDFPNANEWYLPSSLEGSNWFVSDTPQVGSVAVFRKYLDTEFGHVGVVEKVNSDGTLTISQFNGGPNSENYLCSLTPLENTSKDKYIFISNTTNPVIELSTENVDDNEVETDEETSSLGSAANIGGESWIDYNAQQYKIVTTYFTGDTCTLVAIPNSGFAFDYWQDPHGNIIYGEENSTYSFTVTEDTAGTYLAYFRRTEVGPGGEEPEEPYDPENPIEYKYYAYSVVQSYIQQRGQAYWNYKKNKWLVGYGPFLTSKFIELEYVESNKASQQWMSLGWKPSPLTILEFTGQFTDISGDQVIGSRYCGVHVQDGSMWFECGSSTQPIEFDTNVHTFKINCGTGECYLDNVLYSCAKLDRVAKSPIKLFGLDNEDFAGNKVALDPYSSSFRLYSAKIWDINPNSPNMLVRDLVPVRRWHREEDQALYVGLWDRVFNRFYQSNAYMTIDGEYTQIKLMPGPDVIENNEPKVLEKTYR